MTEASSPTVMTQWTDEFLNKMRLTGDEIGEATAHQMFGDQSNNAIFAQLKSIASNDISQFQKSDLPDFLVNYFTTTRQLPPGFVIDDDKIETACKVFDNHGLKIVNILFFKSLPAGYMAVYPAKVMATTQLIETQAARRVLETAQMIFDVLRRGWYKDDGTGIISILKVRLMHAGMRCGISHRDAKIKWDPNDQKLIPGVPQGVPINQEDLVLTLNLFSIITIQGLSQLGISLTPEEIDAYLYNWQLAGYFLGIRQELMPPGVEQTWALQNKICQRLYTVNNDYGHSLTEALLDVVNTYTKKLISIHLLENVTMYMLDNPMSYKILKLHQPDIFDRILNSLLDAATKRARQNLIENEQAAANGNTQKKGGHSGFLFFIFARRANVNGMGVDTFKMALFENICKSVLKGMQQQATLSSNKKFFIDDRLVEQWDLEGFSWDDDTEKLNNRFTLGQQITILILVLVSPVISGIALFEFFRIAISKHAPTYPLGRINLNVVHRSANSDVHYLHDMLGIGVLFFATTLVAIYSLVSKSRSPFVRYAYALIVIAGLAWLLFA